MNKSSEKSPFSVAVLLVKSSTDLSPGAGGTGWAEQSGAGILAQQVYGLVLTEPGQQAWPPLLILNITFLPPLIK